MIFSWIRRIRKIRGSSLLFETEKHNLIIHKPTLLDS